MSIISHEGLLKDSIEVLVNNFEIDEAKAKEVLTEDEILYIADKMYEKQEFLLSEMAQKIIKGKL